MLVNYAKLTEESKRLAAIQYIRLLGQKDPENVIQEDNGFYSHTNTKGKRECCFRVLRLRNTKV